MKNTEAISHSIFKFVQPLLVIGLLQLAISAQSIWNIAGPQTASDIDVGGNYSVWVIGTDPSPGGFGIYQSNGSGWTRIDGAAVRIAVDKDGNPWVVNDAGNIYQRQNGAWNVINGVLARDIDIDHNNNVWIADNQGNVRRRNPDTTWTTIGTNQDANRIAVDIAGVPWIIKRTNSVLLWRQKNKWVVFNLNNKALAIATGGNDSIWKIETNKMAGELSGTGFGRFDLNNLKEISVDPRSNAWVIDDTGAIKKLSGKNPLPDDPLRLAAQQDSECQNLAKRRWSYVSRATILYDGDPPPDPQIEIRSNLCQGTRDYVATIRCFEEKRATYNDYDSAENCRAPYNRTITYTVDVKTGTPSGAGTDSNISLAFCNRFDRCTTEKILNPLVTRDAFENGNTDRVSFAAENYGEIAYIKLQSDGSYSGSAWYPDSITVYYPGHNAKSFSINQWIQDTNWHVFR